MTTDIETNQVSYLNQYAVDLIGIPLNPAVSLFDFISKASWIFFESYIRPALIKDGQCTEVQITLVSQKLGKINAVANVSLIESVLFWSIQTAENRDKLYQELLSAREHLENQNEKLLELTRLDPLTSLLNRRAAADDFMKMANQLTRSFCPTSFLIIDIDWFKEINDNHGHGVGDEVLTKLANTFKEASRSTDILARWGGEEFLIILFNSNVIDAQLFASRLHEKIKSILLPNSEQLTVSIGISGLRENELKDNELLDKVLKRADTALYKAKEKGRNRTEILE
ncbi:GGDEF domain-containing protein [Brumicola blandensis]|uniref:diguanylate cyclase n=1 Tax=Brumicola blandensis TaxID=3075611 RepID=A0AAW8R533_9ALTE|nr:GGDEF domain-containing protein [Alteromonas sp. W409]MDT0582945.1 GGDEF domain-containing protein [Alteromonas sp. W409]